MKEKSTFLSKFSHIYNFNNIPHCSGELELYFSIPWLVGDLPHWIILCQVVFDCTLCQSEAKRWQIHQRLKIIHLVEKRHVHFILKSTILVPKYHLKAPDGTVHMLCCDPTPEGDHHAGWIHAYIPWVGREEAPSIYFHSQIVWKEFRCSPLQDGRGQRWTIIA